MLFTDKAVSLPLDKVTLEGTLKVPLQATGIIVYAQAGFGSHQSSHCRYIANQLLGSDLGLLCVDLLTASEARASDLSSNVDLLARRLAAVCRWAQQQPALHGHRLGLLARGLAAVAALKVAASPRSGIGAVVIFAGHADLTTPIIAEAQVPTLLLVSGETASAWRERVQPALREPGQLQVVAQADSSFREVTTLRAVTKAAVTWYDHYLPMPVGNRTPVVS